MNRATEWTLEEALAQADGDAKRINLAHVNEALKQVDDEEDETEWTGAD